MVERSEKSDTSQRLEREKRKRKKPEECRAGGAKPYLRGVIEGRRLNYALKMTRTASERATLKPGTS